MPFHTTICVWINKDKNKIEKYLEDYASPDTKKIGNDIILREIENIPNEKVKNIVRERLVKIENNERDFRF